MKITLTRKQIDLLNTIALHFKEVDKFSIETDSSSCIGTGIFVRFELFCLNDSSIDITDVKD